jgi:hypothetical protein
MSVNNTSTPSTTSLSSSQPNPSSFSNANPVPPPTPAPVLPPALASKTVALAPKRSSAAPVVVEAGAPVSLPLSPTTAPVLPSRVAELIRAAGETDLVLENGERDIGAWQKQDSCEAERGRVAERASAARELKKKKLLNEKRESHNKAVDPSLASPNPSLASPNPSSASPRSAPLASRRLWPVHPRRWPPGGQRDHQLASSLQNIKCRSTPSRSFRPWRCLLLDTC